VIRGNATYTATIISQEELEAVAGESETQAAQSDNSGCASTLSGAVAVSVAVLLCPMILVGKKKIK
jgi:hypothetical protein